MRLAAQGIGVEVPQGWDGEIYRTTEGFAAQGNRSGSSEPVMHLSNFGLPAERGDYGSGAVELMRSDNILIVLVEFGTGSVGTALFASSGVPLLDAADFDPNRMQRLIQGQSGAQHFFNHNGRAFCLYVALGSHARRHELVAEANQVLATLDLDPA